MPNIMCSHCACPVPEGEEMTAMNYTLCRECYNSTHICNGCNRLFNIDDMNEYHGNYLCNDCFDSHFERCICCGTRFDLADVENRERMCAPCAEEHFICMRCGLLFRDDDYGGDELCEECYRNEHTENEHTETRIKPYHQGADCGPVFRPNNKESLYFGVELETDNYMDIGKAAELLDDLSRGNSLFWLEEDSSLDKGIEIISQPCTLDYHRDKFPWKGVIAAVKAGEGKAENTETAALHIHFSRSFFGEKHCELYQLRLVYLFERFYPKLAVLGRASSYLLNRSAKRYNNNLYNKRSKAKIWELQRYWRYQAVNLCNSKTIEIRIFRSTLVAGTILASLELVDFLARLVKKTSTKKLQAMTWKELEEKMQTKSYHYLPQYIAKLKLEGKL